MTWIQGNPVQHSWHQSSRASQEGSPKQGLAANTNAQINTNTNINSNASHVASISGVFVFVIYCNGYLGKPANVKHECIIRGLEVICIAWIFGLLPATFFLVSYVRSSLQYDAPQAQASTHISIVTQPMCHNSQSGQLTQKANQSNKFHSYDRAYPVGISHAPGHPCYCCSYCSYSHCWCFFYCNNAQSHDSLYLLSS